VSVSESTEVEPSKNACTYGQDRSGLLVMSAGYQVEKFLARSMGEGELGMRTKDARTSFRDRLRPQLATYNRINQPRRLF
jgi:hypothetical protein